MRSVGAVDEVGETALFGRYNIPYWYEIEHLPDLTSKVAGSGFKYRRHFFHAVSNANRAAVVEVTLSKIYPTGY